MQDITIEELQALPNHKQVKAFARALRAADIDHDVIGRFEGIENLDITTDELMENQEFVEHYMAALKETFLDDLLEGMAEKGLVVPTGVDDDGLVIYTQAEDVVLL